MHKVLLVGGSDSGGGAGIQADLKTVTALGCFGTTAITALTAQNTLGVEAIHPVPPAFVAQQIDSIMQDIGTDALKTGMLLNKEIIEVVSGKIRQYKIGKVVVDPVISAKGGGSLFDKSALGFLISELLPLALIVTPNLPEAEVLTGRPIKRPSDVEEAARLIFGMGVKGVLIKGGHAPREWYTEKDTIKDVFYDGLGFHHLTYPLVAGVDAHGGGCTLASAIAAGLAKGPASGGLMEATLSARNFISELLKHPIKIGQGYETLNHFGAVRRGLS